MFHPWLIISLWSLDCGLRIAECGSPNVEAGAARGHYGGPKLINSEWPFPDFLIDRLDSLRTLGNLPSSPVSSFFSPNCVPWVRNCVRPVVESRWYESERQTRSRCPTAETGEPKLRNSGMGLVELAPPTKNAEPGTGDSLYPRIVRKARSDKKAKRVQKYRRSRPSGVSDPIKAIKAY